jgi:WhiB family redox-sensing transcriptional regulator
MFDTTNAKCRETDPEIFFPVGSQPQNEIKVVLSLCSQCSLFTKCLSYALHHDLDGWWAGTTKAERRKMQKAKGITPKSILYSTDYWLIGEDAIKAREKRNEERKIS